MKEIEKTGKPDQIDPRALKLQKRLKKEAQINEKGKRIDEKNRAAMGLPPLPEEKHETKTAFEETATVAEIRETEAPAPPPSKSENGEKAENIPVLTPKTEAKRIKKKKQSGKLIASACVTAVAIILIIALLLCSAFILSGDKGGNLFPLDKNGFSIDTLADSLGFHLSLFGFEIGTQKTDDDSAAISRAMRSTVVVFADSENGGGTGSGIVFTSDGYIITNYHVVEDATEIFVQLYGSKDYVKATLVGYAEHDDIAVIKVDKTALLPAAFLTDLSDCSVGNRVYSIGAPNGHDYSYTVTRGIISAINRDVKIYDKSTSVLEKKMRMIQTDAAVNPGNSGGPLIDTQGRVVGIITMKLEGLDSMGFALPSDGVLPVVAEIIRNGNADGIESTISRGRPLMGVVCVSVVKGQWYVNTDLGIAPIPEEYANLNPGTAFCPQEDGVLVRSTSEGMDAHGKLQSGDIITKVENVRVYTSEQLMSVLNDHDGGDTVTLTVYRDGETAKISIVLKEAPLK